MDQHDWWESSATPEFVARGFRYSQAIVAGDLPACEFNIQACQRSLDWARSPPDGMAFDLTAANHICEFIAELRHIKGEWARITPEFPRGRHIELEDWQCWQLIHPFGWKWRDTMLRVIQQCYWEIARKNAKSTIAAGVGLYMLDQDGEPSPEVYSAATTRDQAAIVFDTAKAMEEKSPHDGLACLAHRILVRDKIHPSVRGLFKALHSEGSTMDGLNIHCAINDELHAWKRADVYEVIETAMGSRAQAMIWNVTTAGSMLEGICYQTRDYMLKILKGLLEDHSFWGCVWTIDDGDEWQDEDVWRKANPNYGVSVYQNDMRRLAKKAKEVTSQQTAFQNKRLNVWTNAADAWMNMTKWHACGDQTLTLDDFLGEECWLGTDLSSKNDIASLSAIFRRKAGKDWHYYNFVRSYLPEVAIQEAANKGHYDGWERAGFIIKTPGVMIDVDKIEEDTIWFRDNFRVKELAFDPGHNATQYGPHMQKKGLLTVEVRPTVLNFSDPMKYMEANVRAGRWHHQNDPCHNWQVSNIEVKVDMKDNIFPRKPMAGKAMERKIDSGIATLIAYIRCLADTKASVFDRDLVVI